MTSYGVSKTIDEVDEVNKEGFEIKAYSLIENGEMSQKIDYVILTVYELKPRKKGNSFDGRFDKEPEVSVHIPVSALKFIVGD